MESNQGDDVWQERRRKNEEVHEERRRLNEAHEAYLDAHPELNLSKEERDQLEREKYSASPEVLRSIFQHIYPRPEALSAIAAAFGGDCDMYTSMRSLIETSGPGTPIDIADISNFYEWLEDYGWLFEGAAPLNEAAIPEQ